METVSIFQKIRQGEKIRGEQERQKLLSDSNLKEKALN